MNNFYCEVCGEPIDPDDSEALQEGVHSHCDPSGVDSTMPIELFLI